MSGPPEGQCGSCGHKGHRGRCSRKGPSRCVPLNDDGTGWACGAKPQCPCPWRTCRCGTEVAVAICADAPEFEETIERGSAGDPAGTLAVRKRADGSLSARPLHTGGTLGEGEWRAIDHDARCPQAKQRSIIDVTDAAGQRIPVS